MLPDWRGVTEPQKRHFDLLGFKIVDWLTLGIRLADRDQAIFADHHSLGICVWFCQIGVRAVIGDHEIDISIAQIAQAIGQIIRPQTRDDRAERFFKSLQPGGIKAPANRMLRPEGDNVFVGQRLGFKDLAALLFDPGERLQSRLQHLRSGFGQFDGLA